MSGMFFSGFLFTLFQHISLDLLSLGSAKAYIEWGGKLNGHLMSGCVRNIRTKNYHNQIIGFQVTTKNVGDVFWDTVYKAIMHQIWFWLELCPRSHWESSLGLRFPAGM